MQRWFPALVFNVERSTMPDITMCYDLECPHRRKCERNPLSGTKPNGSYQSWFTVTPRRDDLCSEYMPTRAVAAAREP
jgi:hypothetical protein